MTTTISTNSYSASPTVVKFLDIEIPLSVELFLFNCQSEISKSTYPVMISHYSNYAKESNLIEEASSTYEPIESFEGYVVNVFKETFVARLTNLTDDSEHEMEIFIDSLSCKDDIKRLEKGAIFFWAISLRKYAEREDIISTLLFRRGACWTKEEIQLAETKADTISNNLGW